MTVPPVPKLDPASAVLENPEVPERKRFCSKCESPVGREKNGAPGRPDGFCTKCGTPYSFSPKLQRGDLVGGQYEVLGCLAHGGLGWIYLAVDRRVSDRWVVLKGLLDTGDEDALAVAIAERRFLAEVDHPNIVRIINFVEHPDLRTGSVDGYIVMEYVGGKSLKDIANERRTPDGRREPLPVEQAIAYALEALPALGYLHSRGLVYCDFKIDNVIQSEDSLKIIDMGAVRRFDDDGPIYGTVGYQAPEIATDGPSPASDLYTVARTLAVLTFDFQGYSTTYRDELPGPEQVAVFEQYESFYRLLVRATDPDPSRRFASAEEMADQLTGVLREILALQDGLPRPALSTLFGPELRVVDTELVAEGTSAYGLPKVAALDAAAAALALPVPRVDPTDPNAGFLATLMATKPGEALTALQSAPVNSVERRLRELRALIELGDQSAAEQALATLEADQPDDWRVVWYADWPSWSRPAPPASAPRCRPPPRPSTRSTTPSPARPRPSWHWPSAPNCWAAARTPPSSTGWSGAPTAPTSAPPSAWPGSGWRPATGPGPSRPWSPSRRPPATSPPPGSRASAPGCASACRRSRWAPTSPPAPPSCRPSGWTTGGARRCRWSCWRPRSAGPWPDRRCRRSSPPRGSSPCSDTPRRSGNCASPWSGPTGYWPGWPTGPRPGSRWWSGRTGPVPGLGCELMPQQTVCPTCAEPLDPDDAFCGVCGMNLAAASPAPESGPATEPDFVLAPALGTGCAHCGLGPVSADGYCEACGGAQPRPRDHMERSLEGVAGVSDRGVRHHRNEDSFTVAATSLPGGAPAVIAVVCDGVSSATRPDEASQAAADAASESLLTALEEGVAAEPAMRSAILVAADAVAALADDGSSPEPGHNSPPAPWSAPSRRPAW